MKVPGVDFVIGHPASTFRVVDDQPRQGILGSLHLIVKGVLGSFRGLGAQGWRQSGNQTDDNVEDRMSSGIMWVHVSPFCL